MPVSLLSFLAKGFSSRLYKRVREEHGLTYFIKSNVDLYSNFGHIQFLMNINYKKLKKQ